MIETKDNDLTLAYELKSKASEMVSMNFDSIQVEMLEAFLEKEFGTTMYEYMIPRSEFKDQDENRDEDQDNYEENDNDHDWYPMWNTLFRYRHRASEEFKKVVNDCGMGIIEIEDEVYIFFSGCGYSFFGAHWIPLWLNYFANDEDKEKYKNVYYHNM